ncbi:aminodeoxychorismate lyase, partial [Klebsiella quasipneumoniae]|nr:aminodeoxychorismate lyase [Klebsiella quasipneumoniae]
PHGQVALLDPHLQRWQPTCDKLRIALDDWLTLSDELQRLARPHAQGVLQVTLTRGVGGRGSRTAGGASPTRILSVSPLPA